MNEVKTAAKGSAAANSNSGLVEEFPTDKTPYVLSRQDRSSKGKALRAKMKREDQGVWKAPDDRPDPIAILRASDAERMEELLPIRYGRMLQSPFAFYRGSPVVMASDLSRTPNTGLRVQSCGDCHLANFGGFATPERNIIFDINDFDETLPAPWEWDVKRLVASIVLAARSVNLSDDQARECAIACSRTYRKRLNDYSKMDPLEVCYQKISRDDFLSTVAGSHRKRVQERIDAAAANSGSELDFPKLAESVGGRIRIRDQPPLIFHPEATNTEEFQSIIKEVFRDYHQTLSDDRQVLLARYQIFDAAIKVVGIGSVGRRCWIALLMSGNNDPLFLQFKEAACSVLEPFAGKSAYGHQGERVVAGQRLMQPVSDIFLGWATGPSGRHFYVRQLRDAKIKPLTETFGMELMKTYARACGWVLARTHAKVGEVTTIAGYLGASSEAFEGAMGRFGMVYADQVECDHAALKAAVREGKITVFKEE